MVSHFKLHCQRPSCPPLLTPAFSNISWFDPKDVEGGSGTAQLQWLAGLLRWSFAGYQSTITHKQTSQEKKLKNVGEAHASIPNALTGNKDTGKVWLFNCGRCNIISWCFVWTCEVVPNIYGCSKTACNFWNIVIFLPLMRSCMKRSIEYSAWYFGITCDPLVAPSLC